jgi:hypothetical protein
MARETKRLVFCWKSLSPRRYGKMPMSRILFARVKNGHPNLEEGHWFFHEGQWAICASAHDYGTGDWRVQIYFEKFDKPLPETTFRFESLNQAKNFVSEYFEDPVVDCKPSQFPKPSSL